MAGDDRGVDAQFERRMRLYLLGGGTVLGILFGCLVGYGVHRYRASHLPSGAQFESLSDFRRAMLGHDDRDTLPDDNVSLRTLVQPDDSDLIIYRLKPNLSVKFHDVPVTTNSFGMRGPEIRVEKPAGVYRIALLGDSFAFGWGVEEEKTFARVIERELNAALPQGPKVELLNFGVPGYSTFQEVASFEQYGAKFHPDLVLVYWVENDFGLPFFIRDLEKPGELARDADFANLRVKQADTELNAKNQELLHNLDPSRALMKLGDFATEHNIRVLFTMNPGKGVNRDEGRLWGLRQRKQITVLRTRDEVRKIIAERGLQPEQLKLPTDPHPSAVKHEIIGQVLARQIREEVWPNR